MESNLKQINYGIREIKELEFYADESKSVDDNFDYNIQAAIQSGVPEDRIQISITANYYLAKTQDLFMKCTVKTVFEVVNLRSHARVLANKKEVIDLPDQFWGIVFGLSISHTRAVLARSSAGTKFGGLILPIVDPLQQFRTIFKQELDANKAEATNVQQ